MSNLVLSYETARAQFSGPQRGVCIVCGKEIAAYESRLFGAAGAAHTWNPDERGAPCVTDSNRHLFPHYYTDG